ncbi:rhodanese-like domain-containing protein [Streptomyces pimonensis]|uniref:Rhodanese-like domain-containing protein n=1 Tax=Streptomyces pimonensis TaxID=2860288 RepID=A0ABV4IU13_9ACTN
MFEWHRVHVPDAVRIPLEVLPERCPELPDDRLLVTFRADGTRSAGAADLLVGSGLDTVDVSRCPVDRRTAGGPLPT